LLVSERLRSDSGWFRASGHRWESAPASFLNLSPGTPNTPECWSGDARALPSRDGPVHPQRAARLLR
jgi:hypothetical protein